MGDDIFWDLSDPLGRAGKETAKSNQALRDYALMGPGRSLRRLCEEYQDQEMAPTKRRATLDDWSSKFAWVDRVALFDLAEFEIDLARYHDDREKWRKRRESMLDLYWARIATVITVWQPGTMVDETGKLRASVNELTGAIKALLNESRIEHEQLPEFAGAGGGHQLSAAINALISRELVRLVNPGSAELALPIAQDSDGGGKGRVPGPDRGDGDG